MELNITLLVQLILFLFLLFWLSNFLFTPLLKLLDERNNKINGLKDESIKILDKAMFYKIEIENKIKEERKKAKLNMLSIKNDGIIYSEKLIINAKKESSKKLEKARNELNCEIKYIRKSLKDKTSTLGRDILYKIIDEKKYSNFVNHNEG